MFEAKQGKEIVLTVENQIGMLSDLSKLLADKGVSILAVSGYVVDNQCVVRLITDDNLRTKDALVERGYTPKEEDAVLLELPHKPGILRRIADALAEEQIDIRHLYATAMLEHDECLLVLHTSNDAHAIVVLNRSRVGV